MSTEPSACEHEYYYINGLLYKLRFDESGCSLVMAEDDRRRACPKCGVFNYCFDSRYCGFICYANCRQHEPVKCDHRSMKEIVEENARGRQWPSLY